MKLITFTVPCYNSAAYMDKCLESLLACGSEEELEIIIVNDGSTDNTGEIADAYAIRHPKVIRVIHQPNGGHGEGVNQGIKNATGLYFKVVDSDDWLDVDSGVKLLAKMREQANSSAAVDLFVCNYVYEHVSDGKQRVMRFNDVFPENRIIGWQDTRSFGISQILCMHTLYYKTSIVRQSGVVLPKHTFYVDNLIAYVPLPYVKTIYYLNLDLYRYFIGRSDQSITEANLVKRFDQHLLVNHLVIGAHTQESLADLDSKLLRYMRNFVRIMIAIVVSIALLSGQDVHFAKINELWELLRTKHPKWYRHIKHGSFLALMNLPGNMGRKMATYTYRVARKVYKFN